MSIPRLALAFALLTTAVHAELEFSGYLRSGESPRFVLTDKATGRTSDFLSLGNSFAGVTLAEFNAAEETLTVKRGAEVLRLRLKDLVWTHPPIADKHIVDKSWIWQSHLRLSCIV